MLNGNLRRGAARSCSICAPSPAGCGSTRQIAGREMIQMKRIAGILTLLMSAAVDEGRVRAA